MGEQSKSPSSTSSRARILEIRLGHSSWYWVHWPHEERQLRFGLSKGRLLLGRNRRTIGINLSNRDAAAWLADASADTPSGVRSAKVVGSDAVDTVRHLPEVEALECSDITSRQFHWLSRLGLPLKFFYLSWSEDLINLGPLVQFTGLIRLVMSDCVRLESIAALQHLVKLRRFDLINCDTVWDLGPLASLPRLRRLVVRNCDGVSNLRPIGVLTGLDSLDLSRCDGIRKLQPLCALTNMRSLDLSDANSITDLSPLMELDNLQELLLFGCENVRDLGPVHRMKGLTKLCLPPHVSDGDVLAVCVSHPTLAKLDMRGCEEVLSLACVAESQALRELNVAGCRGVSDLDPVRDLPALERLDLSCCVNITDLSPLHEVESLLELRVGGCAMLTPEQISAFRKARPQCEVHTI